SFGEMPLSRDRKSCLLGSIQLQRLAEGVDAYKHDCGCYPTSLQSLLLDEGNRDWRGPYQNGSRSTTGREVVPFICDLQNQDRQRSYPNCADGKPGGELLDSDISSRD